MLQEPAESIERSLLKLTEFHPATEMKAKEPLSELKEQEGGDYQRPAKEPHSTRKGIKKVSSQIFKMLQEQAE